MIWNVIPEKIFFSSFFLSCLSQQLYKKSQTNFSRVFFFVMNEKWVDFFLAIASGHTILLCLFHYIPFGFLSIHLVAACFSAHFHSKQMCNHLLDCELFHSFVLGIYLNYERTMSSYKSNTRNPYRTWKISQLEKWFAIDRNMRAFYDSEKIASSIYLSELLWIQLRGVQSSSGLVVVWIEF